MRVSYKWLSRYVDLDGVTPEELAEKLTLAGVEVDGVTYRGAEVKNVVTGRVVQCDQHPNADKLSVCKVDIGAGELLPIVCGAANVAAGQKVPVAKVGAVLPGNFKIKKAKLRGEESRGMICSLSELGVDEHYIAPQYKEGIMVLPSETPVGEDALAHLDLDDAVLDLDLTPNRSDCLSMMGVAYEVGAILERKVHTSEVKVPKGNDNISGEVQVQIEADDMCPQYVARKIKNVKIGPSPLWLQNRLIAANIRPINNVVDVTNFVMLEYGQPLHAFDAAKVEDGHIIVRRARQGERVVTLDDQERQLDEQMLVIADPYKIIAVAGVMGAANSEVTEQTTEIILESAYFEERAVRHASKQLGLRSEASLRFEKGIDPEGILAAADRAAALLAEIAGAEIVQGVAEQKKKSFPHHDISLNMVNLNQRLGTSLTTGDVTTIFDRLEFEYENRGHEISVDIPTRRPDLRIEEDLMEEVARLYGYDRIPVKLPEGVTTPGSRTELQRVRRSVKQYLQGAGLNQVVTYSLTKHQYAEWGSLFRDDIHPIGLSMPMSEDRSHLRTTLVPNLLEVVSYNKNRQAQHTHIFEIGYTFLSEEESLTRIPEHKEVVTAVFNGLWHEHEWQQSKIPVDFYVVKGVVEQLLAKLGIHDASYKAVKRDGYHPGRTAEVILEGQRIGLIGQIHPQIQKEMEIDPTFAFELSIKPLLQHRPTDLAYEGLSKHPGIVRDLAVVVDEEVPAAELSAVIRAEGGSLLKSVHIFDVYAGEHIASGKKSVAFSLLFQDPERTLTDEEVEAVHNKIVSRLAAEYEAELRK